MNMESYNREMKKTSIKCHHPPGGSTNFSLGWGSDQQVNSSKIDQSLNSKYNILTGENNSNVSVKPEDKENVNINCMPNQVTEVNAVSNTKTQFLDFNENSKKSCIKTDYTSGKNNHNIFRGDSSMNEKSQIKFAQTAGGKSSVFFGDDNTSYEEYRRKR